LISTLPSSWIYVFFNNDNWYPLYPALKSSYPALKSLPTQLLNLPVVLDSIMIIDIHSTEIFLPVVLLFWIMKLLFIPLNIHSTELFLPVVLLFWIMKLLFSPSCFGLWNFCGNQFSRINNCWVIKVKFSRINNCSVIKVNFCGNQFSRINNRWGIKF